MNRSSVSRFSVLCLLAVASVSFAQTGGEKAAAAAAAAPRLADGHPDLSGVWWGGADVGARGSRPPGPPAAGAPRPVTFTSLYQPSVAAKAATLSDKDDPTLKCVPTAFGTLNVRLWNVGAVGQIVATPKMVVLLSETFHDFQLVPTDGRPHRDDQPPTYRGDAVGRWDGDTLVVDVTNFTDDTWMSAEGRVSPHSDALHIVERYTRISKDRIDYEVTMEDPNVLTQPWQLRSSLMLREGTRLSEYICAENNVDLDRYERLLKNGVDFTRK